MTTNSVRSQENRQNTQLHPGQDPDIDFHYTFEIFLPKGKSTVYIMKDHEAIGRIPTMAFWNSAECSDSYYETQTLDIENPSDIERDESEILPKQYHQIHVLDMNKPYRPTKTEISAQEKLSLNSKATKYRNGIDEHNIINKDGKSVFEIKEGEAIPGLARDHKVQITKNTEFDFVDLNFGVIDNCKNPGKGKVLTAQAKDCPSCPKIDLPSKACAYDKNDGKIKCSDFGDIRTIERSADSVYYMTVTRDKENNYKFYFSDKDGNKTDDLELRLNDVKIKDPYLLRALESDYNIKKLSEEFEKFINKYSQEKENTELESFGNQRTADFNLSVLSTTIATDPELQKGVAGILATDKEFCEEVIGELTHPSKRGAVINKLMHDFIINPQRDIDENITPKTLADIVKEKLAVDEDFQDSVKGEKGDSVTADEIATQLVTGSSLNTLSTAVASKSELQTGVADNLIDNSSFFDRVFKHEIAETLADDEEFQEDVADEMIYSKTLADIVKEKLIADEAFKKSVKGEKGDIGPQGPAGVQAASRQGVDSNSVATELERSANFQTKVANKLITTKASDLGRAVISADESDSQRSFSRYVKDWVKNDLKGDSAFKTSIQGPAGPKGDSATAEEVASQSTFQTAVANKLITTKAPELGRAVISADESDSQRSFSSYVKDWVKNDLKSDSAFKTSIQGADGTSPTPQSVATELLTGRKNITQLGQAVLDVEKSDASSHPISNIVSQWVITNLETNNKTIKEYEAQVKQIEEDAKLEKENIVRMERTITSKVEECEEHANRALTAADQAEDYAENAKNAADQSERHAKNSEKEAANAKSHADTAVTASVRAKEHADIAVTSATASRKHSTKAEASSSNAAAFAENAKEAACAMNPSLSGCSSRSRREAIWEEPESEYENSELTSDFIFG